MKRAERSGNLCQMEHDEFEKMKKKRKCVDIEDINAETLIDCDKDCPKDCSTSLGDGESTFWGDGEQWEQIDWLPLFPFPEIESNMFLTFENESVSVSVDELKEVAKRLDAKRIDFASNWITSSH